MIKPRTLQIKQLEHGWGFVGRVELHVHLDQDIDEPLTPENEAKLAAFLERAETFDPFKINLWKTKQAAINAATEAGHTVIEPLN